MKRTSYQQGSVICKSRKRGPDVWVFRYMDDGIQKSIPIGTTVKFKTKASARKEADKLLMEINERTAGLTMAGLCDRFNLECKKGGYLRPPLHRDLQILRQAGTHRVGGMACR